MIFTNITIWTFFNTCFFLVLLLTVKYNKRPYVWVVIFATLDFLFLLFRVFRNRNSVCLENYLLLFILITVLSIFLPIVIKLLKKSSSGFAYYVQELNFLIIDQTHDFLESFAFFNLSKRAFLDFLISKMLILIPKQNQFWFKRIIFVICWIPFFIFLIIFFFEIFNQTNSLLLTLYAFSIASLISRISKIILNTTVRQIFEYWQKKISYYFFCEDKYTQLDYRPIRALNYQLHLAKIYGDKELIFFIWTGCKKALFFESLNAFGCYLLEEISLNRKLINFLTLSIFITTYICIKVNEIFYLNTSELIHFFIFFNFFLFVKLYFQDSLKVFRKKTYFGIENIILQETLFLYERTFTKKKLLKFDLLNERRPYGGSLMKKIGFFFKNSDLFEKEMKKNDKFNLGLRVFRNLEKKLHIWIEKENKKNS